MALVSDVLIVSCTLIVAIYCAVLSRRLRRLTQLDGEIGGVIEGLSKQIQVLSGSVKTASIASRKSVSELQGETFRAEAAARHLEILISSLHGLSVEEGRRVDVNPFKARRKTELEKTL